MIDEAHHIARQAAALDDAIDPRNPEQLAAYIEGGHLFSEGECRAAAALIREQTAEIERLRGALAGLANALELPQQRGVLTLVPEALERARAALAAMDTPKGGGDE